MQLLAWTDTQIKSETPPKKSTTSKDSLKLVHFNVTNIHTNQLYLYFFSFNSKHPVSKQDVAFSLTPLKGIVPDRSLYFTVPGRQTAGA